MKRVKFLVSCMVLSMVALLYVVSYAQTTTSVSDDKKACCAKMAGGEGASCENCPCCKDGVCKDKDKHASHAAGMKDGGCKMKSEKAGNTESGDKKAEGCCGSCCAGDACKDMKNKKEAASASQSGENKESCCAGGCCKMNKTN